MPPPLQPGLPPPWPHTLPAAPATSPRGLALGGAVPFPGRLVVGATCADRGRDASYPVDSGGRHRGRGVHRPGDVMDVGPERVPAAEVEELPDAVPRGPGHRPPSELPVIPYHARHARADLRDGVGELPVGTLVVLPTGPVIEDAGAGRGVRAGLVRHHAPFRSWRRRARHDGAMPGTACREAACTPVAVPGERKHGRSGVRPPGRSSLARPCARGHPLGGIRG